MIAFLRGRLLELQPERVIVDVRGVGYDVRIPLSTYYQLERAGEGNECELRIHTQVRDDALELYGFVELAEQQLFERLIGVNGIGPRLAQVILSGMAPAEVIAALAAGDIPRLVKIPGVGKKTAERMVLELRDAARELQATSETAGVEPVASDDDDLVQALVGLGYRPAEAEKAVQAVRAEEPDADFQAVLRMSLRRLSKI